MLVISGNYYQFVKVEWIKYFVTIVHCSKALVCTKKHDNRCQFHQHFNRTFFADILGQKISHTKHSFVFFGAKISYKNALVKR